MYNISTYIYEYMWNSQYCSKYNDVMCSLCYMYLRLLHPYVAPHSKKTSKRHVSETWIIFNENHIDLNGVCNGTFAMNRFSSIVS